MSFEVITDWLLGNKEIISIFAVIATAVGALYRPTLDLLKALPGFAWGLIKFIFQFAWFVAWPLRKLIAFSYSKFFSKHVDRAFDRMFDSFEKREAVKKATQRSTE